MAEIFDKRSTVEPPIKVKKPRKKRAPLSASKKAALVQRLKVAREKKASQRKQAAQPIKIEIEEPKPIVVEKVVEKVVPAKPKAEPKNNKYRENQMELENLRQELEMQNLKNQLEDSRRSKKQTVEEPPMIVNEPDPIIQKVEPIVIKPEVKQPSRYSLAPKNIWGQF
jgi:hypothetical protein